MSKLEKLIKELCPNGVEYKQIKDFTNVLRGKRLTKNELTENEKFAVFHGGLEPLGYYTKSNRPANSVMIINVGASAGTVGFCKEEFWSSDGCYCISHTDNVLQRFLYLVLSNNENFLISHVRKAGIPTLDAKIIENYSVPVPPLSVQAEIVRILDNFTELKTELTTKLTAELTARKKQYEYYRDTLFATYKSKPKKKLIEVANISRGVRVVKKDLFADGKYPVFQNCLAPMGYYDNYNCTNNSTYVISAGAAGEIGFCENNFWAADDCLVFSNLKDVENKFIYYFLMTKKDFIRSNVRKASIPRLSRTVIENLQLPMISIVEQQRIINILDRFDSLCTDISSGLPAEIEARQKQYEYYRDKLLDFKNIDSSPTRAKA